MNVIMTLLVRNAADTLEKNLIYHRSQGINHFIVTDNLSTDDTGIILRRYEKMGWLTVLQENSDTYEQGAWVTRMARLAAHEFKTGWIIHNDADEFWWPRSGNLKEALTSLPADINVVVAMRKNFVYAVKPWYRRRHDFLDMVHHEVLSKNVLGNPLPPKVAHRAHPDVIMPTGNHHVENIGPQRTRHDLVEIFHYPIRSRKQLHDKIHTGCHAVVRNLDKHPGRNLETWKYLHEETVKHANFERLIEHQTYSAGRIRKEILSGVLSRDTRLRDYIRRLERIAQPRPAP